jgi:hypothetical protein
MEKILYFDWNSGFTVCTIRLENTSVPRRIAVQRMAAPQCLLIQLKNARCRVEPPAHGSGIHTCGSVYSRNCLLAVYYIQAGTILPEHVQF